MQGSKWGAPFWIGATRLVGPDAKIVSWPGGSRPSCKQYDTEAKVKKFLQSSSATTQFREQCFIQNMLPHCQATPSKPPPTKPDSKPTTTTKHGSKKKAGESEESASSILLSFLQKAAESAEGPASSLGQLQPYNSQASAASSFELQPGQGTGTELQNQFNLYMIGRQRAMENQLYQQRQQTPNANLYGPSQEMITQKELLTLQQNSFQSHASDLRASLDFLKAQSENQAKHTQNILMTLVNNNSDLTKSAVLSAITTAAPSITVAPTPIIASPSPRDSEPPAPKVQTIDILIYNSAMNTLMHTGTICVQSYSSAVLEKTMNATQSIETVHTQLMHRDRIPLRLTLISHSQCHINHFIFLSHIQWLSERSVAFTPEVVQLLVDFGVTKGDHILEFMEEEDWASCKFAKVAMRVLKTLKNGEK